MSLEVIGYILIGLGVLILLATIQGNAYIQQVMFNTAPNTESDIEWRLGQIENKLGDLVSTAIDISDNTSNIPERKDWT